MPIETLVEEIKQLISISGFFQANFWGILGSVAGLAGLFISWLSFRYNIPKVQVESTLLVTPPPEIVTRSQGKSLAELENQLIPYELEISVRNKRGGSGSIDKPMLVIKTPVKKHWWNPSKKIEVPPITERPEMERVSETRWNTWIERHGRSFNLGGGEKIDDRLEYLIRRPENVHLIVNNYERLRYFIQYRDNRGKLHHDRIKKNFPKE
ncbi:MAG TPA: hypothetical protein VFB03_03510 [Candidatus Saccharimonadales bacterium]|nr:hypothetical protein [Candidatus Saccharimonadales bacterium]